MGLAHMGFSIATKAMGVPRSRVEPENRVLGLGSWEMIGMKTWDWYR
jgi:hypothetical protein